MMLWHDFLMLSDPFQKEIPVLRKENFKIPCAVKHRHKIVIVNAYDVDLYQSWTVELESFLRGNFEVEVTTVEFGYSILHLQRTFLRQLATLTLRHFLRLSRNTRVRHIIVYNYRVKASQKFAKLRKAFSETLRILKDNSFEFSDGPEAIKDRAIFSTLATTLSTVEFNTHRHPLRLFVLNLAYELYYSNTTTVCKEIEPCMLIVGNGRLVKPAAVVASSRANEIPVIIIERGSFPGTFDLYKYSPHSLHERKMQAVALSLRFGSSKTSKISREYIELRREYDPISGLKWHRNFESGLIPDLDNRKLCVCFTSTETEFAVFGDPRDKMEFQNQAQAFNELALFLNPEEWQIVIRRHPYGSKKLKSDPESKLWRGLMAFKHVSFVGPSDPVDSYELCRRADLAAHFSSSMGPEAISMECCPVITMGPTLWERDNSKYLINTKDKIAKLNIKNLTTRPLADIELWGIYWATFGYKFTVVTWNQSKGFVRGKRIL